jgi:hypothetical protein
MHANVSVADAALFEAMMFTTDGHRDWAMLIKGPCCSSWHITVEDYHQHSVFCENTKEKHLNTMEAINMDKARWFHYWLLIFPENVVLDNVIILGDPIHVVMERIGMKKDVNGTECRSSFVYWSISKWDGGFHKKQRPRRKLSVIYLIGKSIIY